MDELRWSQWYPLAQQPFSIPVPDVPGIYEIRTDHEFGRLRGQSRIVYIGSAARGNSPSLRKRLLESAFPILADTFPERSNYYVKQATVWSFVLLYLVTVRRPSVWKLEDW
jgi:hypothetical protein